MKSIGGEGREVRARKKILYVEDEDSNWMVAELRLGQRYQLLRARSAEEACKAICAQPDLDAILMDIQLKGSELDGLQLTRLLRGTLPKQNLPEYAKACPTLTTPIIFITAYESRYNEASLLSAGGSFVVYKPVEFVKLTTGLNNLILNNRITALEPK